MIPFDLKKTVVACLSALYVMDIASVAQAASAVPPGFEDIMTGMTNASTSIFSASRSACFAYS